MTYEQCSIKIRYDKRNLLILGAAGYGKTQLINQSIPFEDTLRLSPTGLAALNINGDTIHSIFEFEPSLVLKTKRKYSQKKEQLIKAASTILIDEISMVRADVLDGIDDVLRQYHCSSKPFGGLRVIMVGDIFQLGPVITNDALKCLRKMYPSSKDSFMFFNSHAFQNRDFLHSLHVLELKTSFRQKDKYFQTILNCIRIGNSSKILLDQFDNCYKKNPPLNTLILTTTRENSRVLNLGKLKQLRSEEHIAIPKLYSTYLTEKEMLYDQLIQSSPMSKPLRLKNGMRLMFVKNDSKRNGKRWINGTMGTLIETKMLTPEIVESLLIKLDAGPIVEVFREINTINRPHYNERTGKITITEVALVYNFPVIMAWAISIHKSQGLTLPNAVVDLESGAFAAGQTYVALSRVRSIENLYLSRSVQKKDISVNIPVYCFYKVLKDNEKINEVSN